MLYILLQMDEHSGQTRPQNGKIFPANTLASNGMTHGGQSQPRLSYNSPTTSSSKDIGMNKQQPLKRIPTLHTSNNHAPFSLTSSGSTRPELSSSGLSKVSLNPNNIGGLGPGTPKHIPSFLENRNQLKSSMFMNEDASSKNGKSDTPSSNGVPADKKLQRMGEQQQMKYSGMEFGPEAPKIPSFLQNQKKIPYQNDQERPESSKQAIYKHNIQPDSLSSSYGSTKKSRIQDFPNEQPPIDSASEWVKRSWSKKKDKKLTLADFDKIKELGSGKYGMVYLVREKKTNFIYALKVIEKKLIRQQEITEQFIRELKIQSFLNHPYIIRLYGFFDDAANIYIIMELGTGGQLFKQLKKHQSMPESKVAGLMRQVCQAVNQLHSYQIIHRDIKPENIVISEGVIKLCDFGWSVYMGDTLRKTFCGTPLFVGPEILKGEEYNQKIDIWSLGVMMYEMFVGENPFKITKEEDLIKIVKDEIKIPNYVDISEQAKDLLFGCLQKNPDHRLSIRELLNHSFFKKYPEKSDKKMAL